ncbi:MAG: AAA family ATPase [Acaryochloris sp. RU_4_1]|nr:AAA family ATPase [Acaryochloris sp. RU_4_1]
MEYKYNPGFSDDQGLIDAFTVRQPNLALIVETIRQNQGTANQHVLVIGTRGMGKTMLVRRVAAEIRTDPTLAQQWYPLVFAEESYSITTPGEFWLQALFHLQDQTQAERWQKAYTYLRLEANEMRLRQQALAQLMDFADSQEQRILLVVENLNMLFEEQLGSNDDWDLRHTLQNEPRVMLLGTTTHRFQQIDHVQKAWFEFFAIYELEALSHEDCQRLWEAITGEPISTQQIRPIRTLTGGNPRLLRVMAGFAIGKSFSELMTNLSQLIDEHTDYFKGQLDNLPATERKIFVALLQIWDPASAREVATAARISVSQTSVSLKRLMERGAVVEAGQVSRKKLYQVTERL